MNLQVKKMLKFIPLLLVLLVSASPAFATGDDTPLGLLLPTWSIIPFVGMLLSIAIFPIVNGHWCRGDRITWFFSWHP